MNRLILKYGRLVTALILAIFAWVIYRRVANGDQFAAVLITAGIVWSLGVPAFICLWPRFTVGGYLNRLYAVPTTSSTSASRASLLATGTDDLLYLGGWLDLTMGPQVLHVPEMAGRITAWSSLIRRPGPTSPT